MSGCFQAGVVGFDITPRIHPRFGAWGTTPSMTEVDLPLLGRCFALEQDGRLLVWYGLDLIGDSMAGTDEIRDEVAEALTLKREQILWSTSQTHSSGALPGSTISGSSITAVTEGDPAFVRAARERWIESCIQAGRAAIDRLQPARIWSGRGYCDSMSYNRRLPMPTGGVKFSRHHGEGLQSGKFFDPTIGLVRFDDLEGHPLGVIFNFGAHPATMIGDKWISPDWVGTARACIEQAVAGAPAMFCQGFCGDVNCYHLFGKPDQARATGTRLGQAAVEALAALIPVRAEPFSFEFKTIHIDCQPMPTREQFEKQIAARLDFIEELQRDPAATWFCGINAPDQLNVEQKTAFVGFQLTYLREGLRLLHSGETPRTTLPFTLGVVRIGDVAAVMSPGENFAETGRMISDRSPFAHTLICGDTNGLFGYIGPDGEIARGGYETDSSWKSLEIDGFRLAPAMGTADKIIDCSLELLRDAQRINT